MHKRAFLIKRFLFLLIGISVIAGFLTYAEDFDEPSIAYDSYGRIISLDYSDDVLDVNYTYWGSTNNATKMIDYGHRSEVYYYSEKGLLINETYKDSSELNTNYLYDSQDNLIKIIQKDTVITYTYKYGVLNYSKINNSEEGVEEYFYDSAGNLIKFINSEGKLETYVYQNIKYPCMRDVCTRKENICPSASTTCFQFLNCTNDNCVILNCSKIEYKSFFCNNSFLDSANINGNSVKIVYNKNGSMTSLNVNGVLKEYSYDNQGNLIKEIRDGSVLKEINCTNGVCQYSDESETLFYKQQEDLCDGKDSNGNKLIDEGCDLDGDGYVNADLECNGSFVSNITKVAISSNASSSIIQLKVGWNMVSFPVLAPIPSSDLISSCGAAGIRFSNSTYALVKDYFISGEGYMIYSKTNCDFNMDKYGFAREVIVNLNSGWNLVPGTLDLSTAYPQSSKFFNYDGKSQIEVITSDSTKSVWAYLDSTNLLNCSGVDLDDENPYLTII